MVGITIVGALPNFPTGDAHAMLGNPGTAEGVVSHVLETVPMVVVVVELVGMVTVAGVDFEKKRAADPMTTMATIKTMTPRRKF